jgi:YD repeat-containing protein
MVVVRLHERTDPDSLMLHLQKQKRAGGFPRVVAGCAAVCVLLLPCLSHADDITYGYDALGRLTSVTVAGNTAYYDYDAAGNITAIRRPGSLTAARADDALSVASGQASAH